MSAIYYTIVYRPQGSVIWTPWYGNDDDETQVWLHKPETVMERIREIRSKGYTRYMHGLKITVPIEFAMAKCEVEVEE